MNQLWATWRMGFVTGKAMRTCLFCSLNRSRSDRQSLRVTQTQHSFVVLNAYPYNSGHIMVAPRRHAASLTRLTKVERADLVELLERSERAVRRAYAPEGLNVGVNLGRCAGAGVTGHVHIHVLPRWEGDTNFMPTLAQTKVLPESLSASWKKLGAAFLKER